MERRTAYFVAASAFAAHNAEEALAIPHYLPGIEAVAPALIARRAEAVTTTVFIEGTLVVTVIAAALAAWAIRRPRHAMACGWMLLFQSVVLLNTVAHVVAAMALRGYAPGLVTAVVVNGPFSVYVLGRAWRERWVARRTFGALAPAAVVVHGPLLAVLLGTLAALTGP